jgi:hypothetical protein
MAELPLPLQFLAGWIGTWIARRQPRQTDAERLAARTYGSSKKRGPRRPRKPSEIVFVLTLIAAFVPRGLRAEKILATGDGWQVYSDGRAGGFVTWAYGQGYPAPIYGVDANGQFVNTPIFGAKGGGFGDVTDQGALNDPSLHIPPGVIVPGSGTINDVSIRSGFVTNFLGFGIRGNLTASTSAGVYLQFWSHIESADRLTNQPTYLDAQQGYAKLEGPWGMVLLGRTRALFSRGLTDIEVLYRGASEIDRVRNFGGNYGAGLIYGTPPWRGLELDVGLFDPIAFDGGNLTRTKYPLAEAELTFERKLGGGWGKIVLFADGAYQKVYQSGYCQVVSDPVSGSALGCDQTIAGVGYGGRLDLGRFHLGAAGYYESGLGLNDPLEIQNADQDPLGVVRRFAGTYVQVRIELGKLDLFGGWGMVWAFKTDYDRTHIAQDPRDPMNPNAQVFPFSLIESQTGINAGVVYHVTPSVHFDVDLVRERADWTPVDGYPGPSQVVYITNSGIAVNW